MIEETIYVSQDYVFRDYTKTTISDEHYVLYDYVEDKYTVLPLITSYTEDKYVETIYTTLNQKTNIDGSYQLSDIYSRKGKLTAGLSESTSLLDESSKSYLSRNLSYYDETHIDEETKALAQISRKINEVISNNSQIEPYIKRFEEIINLYKTEDNYSKLKTTLEQLKENLKTSDLIEKRKQTIIELNQILNEEDSFKGLINKLLSFQEIIEEQDSYEQLRHVLTSINEILGQQESYEQLRHIITSIDEKLTEQDKIEYSANILRTIEELSAEQDKIEYSANILRDINENLTEQDSYEQLRHVLTSYIETLKTYEEFNNEIYRNQRLYETLINIYNFEANIRQKEKSLSFSQLLSWSLDIVGNKIYSLIDQSSWKDEIRYQLRTLTNYKENEENSYYFNIKQKSQLSINKNAFYQDSFKALLANTYSLHFTEQQKDSFFYKLFKGNHFEETENISSTFELFVLIYNEKLNESFAIQSLFDTTSDSSGKYHEILQFYDLFDYKEAILQLYLNTLKIASLIQFEKTSIDLSLLIDKNTVKPAFNITDHIICTSTYIDNAKLKTLINK